MNQAINDIQFFIGENDKKPIKPPTGYIHEYAENKRYMPPNTPFPGKFKNSRTPYCIEPMENMSPFSPIQHTVLMWGAQDGKTTIAENVACYYIDELPAEILFISATSDLLEKWATKRLEKAIDSCGFRHKIYAQTENKHSRRTGDKTFTKEYVGGALDLASAQSAPSLRSDSKRILLRDEIDGAPVLLRTGEGNWLDVSFARTNAWGTRKKILDTSTPGLEENSAIYVLFLAGDQRYYVVFCPLCNKPQILDFGDEKTQHGMKAETKAGQLVQAYYICDYCHDAIFNHHKTQMLAGGYWEPTSISNEKQLRSYQLSSLYSPVGMLSWTELWQKYQKALLEPDGMRSFTNLYLGLPYKETGHRPDVENVLELQGGYKETTVPDGVIFITIGIDVQRGSEKDEKNPARLEMEILGIGKGYRTWSIAYKVIKGAVDDPYSGAWEKLNNWAMAGNLTFKREYGGDVSAVMVFIDSGDGVTTDAVYKFTDMWQNTYPSKGVQALKKKKTERPDERIDELGTSNFKRYRAVKLDSGNRILYDISTNYYKNRVYNNLKIERVEGNVQRPGFCSFPDEYPKKYFDGLTAEEKRADGSFYCPSGRRNEPLDCRVMAECAGDVYLDAKVLEFKALAKNRGADEVELQRIDHKAVLNLMERNIPRTNNGGKNV